MTDTGLDTVVDPEMLKSLWKRQLRPLKRKFPLGEFELAHDPVEAAWLDWDLDQILSQLSQEVIAGKFRAEPARSLRAAKGSGLTRPLTFLSIRDQLVYKALVARATADLLRHAKPWTAFGRADSNAKGKNDDDGTGDSGWFRAWLERTKQLWRLMENHDWVVESDIANFFPSIDLHFVMDHVRANSRLDDASIRLLDRLIREVSPGTVYKSVTNIGLPQENFDCSRVLAHGYLIPFDNKFAEEGKADRYTRWMDDIAIGADSPEEALQKVRELQQALEPLGLAPNTAKTRIVKAEDFSSDYMKEENDYLGEIDAVRKAGEEVDRVEFRRRVARHVHRGRPRPKGWPRVLKRYYTTSRRLDDDWLLRSAFGHLRDEPVLASSVLDYLRSYRLTPNRFHRLREVVASRGEIYEDIALRIHEYLLTAPNIVDQRLYRELADWGAEEAEKFWTDAPLRSASGALIAAKFGEGSHLDRLERLFRSNPTDSPARSQALVILVSQGRLDPTDPKYIPSPVSFESVATARFMHALWAKDVRAMRIAMDLLTPVERGIPLRYVVSPRALVWAPLAAKTAENWKSRRIKMLTTLKSNPIRLRDFGCERLLASL